VSGGV